VRALQGKREIKKVPNWCVKCETLTQGQDPSSGPCVSAAAFDAPSALSTVENLIVVTNLLLKKYISR